MTACVRLSHSEKMNGEGAKREAGAATGPATGAALSAKKPKTLEIVYSSSVRFVNPQQTGVAPSRRAVFCPVAGCDVQLAQQSSLAGHINGRATAHFPDAGRDAMGRAARGR